MDSPIPPDPYVALGVTKDADADSIKKAYRKLALKLHPDKCIDESQKAARTDEFTKIQQAYDIIGDDEKRGRYDAQVRLAELRRQNMEMRGAAGGRGDSKYNVRMSTPRDAPREASYSARGAPPRSAYEQPRPRYYEDEYEAPRTSARKTSGADEFVYVRRSAPRDEKREQPRKATSPREEEKRRDSKRREAEIRDARSTKYEDYEDRRRRDYDSMRRQAEASDSYGSSTEKITEERLREAQKHMDRHTRPSMPRRESSRQVPGVYRESSDPRRSAAAPREKERRRASPSKDERRRENVDPYDRRVPNLSTHASAPPVVENNAPPQPHRSYTTPAEFDKKKKAKDVSPPPPPPFARSSTQPLETMAGAPSSSKRREAKTRAMPEDSGYSSPAATPGYSTTYSYADERPAANVSYSNGHRTVFREPSSCRRNESPQGRPSKGAMKMAGLDPNPKVKRTTQYSYSPGPGATPIVEPAKSSSRRERVTERDPAYSSYDRSRTQYFGEHGAGTTDSRYGQRGSPYEDVNYSSRPTAADVRYATGRGREYEKPMMQRSTTFAY